MKMITSKRLITAKRLFVLAYRDRGGANRVTADSHSRYFLPRVKIENFNFEIGGSNFYY